MGPDKPEEGKVIDTGSKVETGTIGDDEAVKSMKILDLTVLVGVLWSLFLSGRGLRDDGEPAEHSLELTLRFHTKV